MQGQRQSTRHLPGSLVEMGTVEQSVAGQLLSTQKTGSVLEKSRGEDGHKFRLIHRHRGFCLILLRASLFSRSEVNFPRARIRGY